jgi:hypothetical protein
MPAATQALHAVFRANSVVAAYAFAARAHAGQTRKSGESVLSHLLATASILAELGMPEEVVAAGLLHDVLCDTRTSPAQLSAALPAPVAELVSRVSQLNQLSQNYRDNTHTLEAEAMLDMLTGACVRVCASVCACVCVRVCVCVCVRWGRGCWFVCWPQGLPCGRHTCERAHPVAVAVRCADCPAPALLLHPTSHLKPQQAWTTSARC